jgi:hypothetical protein
MVGKNLVRSKPAAAKPCSQPLAPVKPWPTCNSPNPSNTHGVPGRSSKLKFSRSSTGFFGPIQNVIATYLSNQLGVVLLDVLHCGLNKGLVALRLNHQAALAIDYFAHVSPSTH